MVVGIPDFWIWSAFLLCLFSAALCVVYGLMNWNKGNHEDSEQLEKEVHWQETETEIEEKL